VHYVQLVLCPSRRPTRFKVQPVLLTGIEVGIGGGIKHHITIEIGWIRFT